MIALTIELHELERMSVDESEFLEESKSGCKEVRR